MKAPVFDYLAPTSLDEALALRAEHAGSAVVLAGGQSLVPMLNFRLARPDMVIDLGRVAELAGITEWEGGVAVGAMTRQRAAERSELIARRTPLVTRALSHVAHATIRNRGTVGGSLAQADPRAELPAAMLALDAQLVLRSSDRGERTVVASDFFRGFLTTAIEPDELLVEIRVPGLAERSGVGFVEITRRHRDFALVGAAAALSLDDDGLIADARLVLTCVGHAPERATAAETLLRGQAPGPEAFAAAAQASVQGLQPPSDLHASAAYRLRVGQVVARRALEEATPA